jgi:hypothetical protein
MYTSLHFSRFVPNPLTKIGWLCHILFILSTSCTKISVLILYQRLISPFNNRKILWTIRAALAFVSLFMFIFFVLPFVTCSPFQATWLQADQKYKDTHKYHCVHDKSSSPIAAGFSAMTDFIAVIIPLAILYSLRRPLRQKAGLYTVFATGFL